MTDAKIWSGMLALLLLGGVGAPGHAHPVRRGTAELRPSIGVVGRVVGQPTQLLMGLDYAYAHEGSTAFVFGSWVSVSMKHE